LRYLNAAPPAALKLDVLERGSLRCAHMPGSFVAAPIKEPAAIGANTGGWPCRKAPIAF
jgi:hypothetical protein